MYRLKIKKVFIIRFIFAFMMLSLCIFNYELKEKDSETNLKYGSDQLLSNDGVIKRKPDKHSSSKIPTRWYKIAAKSNNTIGYIYSAYMDTRNSKQPSVLILAVANIVGRDYHVGRDYICRLMYKYNETKNTNHVSWKINAEHHGFR